MKKAYIIFPFLALLVFVGFWWNFHTEYEAKQQEKVRLERQVKIDKLRKEAQDRERAIKDAYAEQSRRKLAKEAKEIKDRADREARQAALEARNKSYRDRNKLENQVERLTGEIKVEKEAIAKLVEQNRKLVDEEKFLRTYVGMAEANSKNLSELIDEIGRADAARAAAAAAAAAAAKYKS
jgi:F0F1-type ATP synthase membrane subunit b/b'